MVSGMARHGVAPHVADKILNHVGGTISGVAAVYQRHEFLNERRDALERWGAQWWPTSGRRSGRTEGRVVSPIKLVNSSVTAAGEGGASPQGGIVARLVTETQAEAILAEIRPGLRDRPPIDQFRDRLDATVETICAIHRVTALRAVDGRSGSSQATQRAKTALGDGEELRVSRNGQLYRPAEA